MATDKNKQETQYFKNRPLVRSGNTIYYGDPGDEFVALLQVQGTDKFSDLELANKVTVQIIATDPTIEVKDRIVRRTEKNGLYNALAIASIWLARDNKET